MNSKAVRSRASEFAASAHLVIPSALFPSICINLAIAIAFIFLRLHAFGAKPAIVLTGFVGRTTRLALNGQWSDRLRLMERKLAGAPAIARSLQRPL